MVIPGQDYHYMQDTAYNFFRGTDNVRAIVHPLYLTHITRCSIFLDHNPGSARRSSRGSGLLS
jgi:hypothetical protein